MENNAFTAELRPSALHCDCNYHSHKPHSMAAIPHEIAVYNAGESIHHALLLLSQLPFPHYPSRICTPL